MGKWYEKITDEQASWMREQHMFFVASAAASGYVSVSPKGHAKECFAILDDKKVAYLDMSGSGAETFAHSKVDGRITLLFVAFTGPPKILRLHGTCECILREDVPASLCSRFSDRLANHPGFRAVVSVSVARVSTSCGFSIPKYDFVSDRTTLYDFFQGKTPQEMNAYLIQKNSFSINRLASVGHRLHKKGNPRVVMRLTDGSGKPTPNAKDGFWFAYEASKVGLPALCRDTFRSWLWSLSDFVSWRDVRVFCFGAMVAVGLMRRKAFR